MKKIIILLISFILLITCVNLYAQNPFCSFKQMSSTEENTQTKIPNERVIKYQNAHRDEEGCGFRFILEDTAGVGWSSKDSIKTIVNGVDYGSVTLPWLGGGYAEVIKLLPSGEVQFIWIGEFFYPRHCFEIYNSYDSLIYKSDKTMPDTYPLFCTYQNECPECISLTDFNGEYISETDQVNLSWEAPISGNLQGFDIVRNDELIIQVDKETLSYTENTANLESGKYKYCVVPVYPYLCSFEEENCFETHIGLGIHNYTSNLFLYPNPTKGELRVTSYGLPVTGIEVYDVYGRNLLPLTSYLSPHTSLDISSLQAGIYFVKIYTESEVVVKKVIKQ